MPISNCHRHVPAMRGKGGGGSLTKGPHQCRIPKLRRNIGTISVQESRCGRGGAYSQHKAAGVLLYISDLLLRSTDKVDCGLFQLELGCTLHNCSASNDQTLQQHVR